MNPTDASDYVLVTPAYNEEQYIGMTIESVLAQTVLPGQWQIVDDGSTDRTAEIIHHYAKAHPWIHYIRRSKVTGQSYYSSNVYALREGIRHLEDKSYDFLGILDADIVLLEDYYERILRFFRQNEKLGIASGVYQDRIGENRFRKILNDRRSTPKALMVFRKTCYDEIGGFVPMKYGGEDSIACFTARMKGWKTWSFPDLVAIHNKPVGTGHSRRMLMIRFRQGIGEYFLASHPFFMLLKCIRRCFKESPFLIGGGVRFAGFLYAHLLREKKQLSEELIQFIRKEQFLRAIKGNRIPSEWRVIES